MNGTTETTTSIIGGVALTGGTVNNRVRCNHCKHLFPAYVARADGTPLRYSWDWDRTTGKRIIDPSLDKGSCVMAYDAFDTCPSCGASWDMTRGRNAEVVGIKVKMSTNACDTVCAFATGTMCKCECGGMNHGTRG